MGVELTPFIEDKSCNVGRKSRRTSKVQIALK